MKSDKKVRITVTIPKKEGEKLRSFPYYASFIVSCLLEELFDRVAVTDVLKEINATDNAGDKLAKLKCFISEAFSDTNRNRVIPPQDKASDYWERWNVPEGGK